MTNIRRIMSLVLLAALMLGSVAWTPAEIAAATWTDTEPLPAWNPEQVATYPAAKLGEFTATPLSNGLVLALGGHLVPDAAVYNWPTNNWVATARPARSRYKHAITPMANGQVLVTGGWGPCCVTPLGSADAERFDSVLNRWTPAAPMAEPRANHTATLLDDGSVLVVGGDWRSVSPSNPQPRIYATAERYDPVADRWQPVAPMAVPRTSHTATRLPDGSVLVVGGDADGTAERYDPATNAWSPAGSSGTPRRDHTATLLHDGTVLVVGGGAGEASTAAAARYNPLTNGWTPVESLGTARRDHSATLLTDGTLVVAGGRPSSGPVLDSVERYDQTTNAWTPLPPMNRVRVGHGAALINGRVLVVGGETAGANPTAEWYDPGTPGVCFVQTGRCLRGDFLAYWGANGGLARNGFPLSDEFAERLEDGRVYRVQYFERVRLESHPENAAPYNVLLGQFGRRIRPADPPLPPPTGPLPADRVYFAETGHFIVGGFFNYWYVNGGLAQFGYPLTEVFTETLEDGKQYRVQYFERARLEYHPENPAPYDILLGQFGRRIWGGR